MQGQGSRLTTIPPREEARSAAGESARQAWAEQIFRRLIALYGQPIPRAADEASSPLDVLVETILSQHTSDVNSSRAFANLRRAFPTWEAVRSAPLADVEEAIRVGGLARVKARRIQECLDGLAERYGSLSLDFLRGLPTPEARRLLLAIPGVGPKTAACVLLFSLGRSVIPVDTHVHRVSRRLGLVPGDATPDETEATLESLFRPEWHYACHIDLIAHGRRVCVAPRPKCEICGLSDLCVYFATVYLAGKPA